MPSSLKRPEYDPYEEILSLLREGKSLEAIDALKSIRNIEHGQHEELMAEALLMIRQPQGALEWSQMAIKFGHDVPNVHRILAAALWHLGDRTKARKELFLAKGAEAFATAAAWSITERKFAEGELYALQSLEIEPTHDVAQQALLHSRSAQGDAEAWKKLLELWTTEHRLDAVTSILAEAYRRQEKELGRVVAKEALSEIHDDPEFYRSILYFYARIGEEQTAMELLSTIPQAMRSSPLMIRFEGQLALKSGRPKDAVELFENAASMEPSNLNATLSLLEALSRSGRWLKIPRAIARFVKANG